MGKGEKKYEKTKFSREKTIIYDEEDQAANDERLAKEHEIRGKEKQRNTQIALGVAKEDAKPEEKKKKKMPRSYDQDYMENDTA